MMKLRTDGIRFFVVVVRVKIHSAQSVYFYHDGRIVRGSIFSHKIASECIGPYSISGTLRLSSIKLVVL
jgi:hypothetical protein